MVAAAALPRLLALAIERDDILEEYVEKSDTFARTLVSSGTFGFLPDVPSAYTQPLYAWFLAGLYWPLDRSWVVVGLAQIALAIVTALLVLAIGRHLASVRVGVIAALVSTLHPYLVWHDVHVNREIVDGVLLATLVLLVLLAHDRRSIWLAVAAGAVAGLAILSNARLVLLPLVVAPFVAWRFRPGRRAVAAGVLVVVASVAVLAPWVARNRATIGCATITTDTRALWKANNPATYDVLARGGWIDDVPDLPGVPPWPEKAASISVEAAKAVDECAQASFYRDEVLDFWRDEPGEKARLAVQAVGMLWSPFLSVDADDPGQQGLADLAQRTVEPAFVLVLYALALLGSVARRRAGSSCSPRCSSPTTPSPRWCSPGPCATGRPGTSCSRCSPRSRSNAPGSCSASGDGPWLRAPCGRARRCGRCTAPGRTPRAPGRAPQSPNAAVRAWFGARARIASASCSTSEGGTSRPDRPSCDDLGKPSDGARDHGPAALHRLERDHPEALAERRHDDDLRALEDLTDALDATEERDDVVEAELGHGRFGGRPRARRRRRSRASRRGRRAERRRAHAGACRAP